MPRRSSELTGVSTTAKSASKALGSRTAGGLLEPRDELGDGEGLRKSRVGARAGGGGGLSSRLDRGGGGDLGRGSGRGGGRGARDDGCGGRGSSHLGGEDKAGGDGRNAGNDGRSSGCGAVGGRLGGHGGGRVARAGTAAGDGASGSGVVGRVETVVVVGDVDVLILSLVSSGELDGRAASGTSGTSDLELSAAHVELATADSLGGVESQHFRAKEVLAAGEAGRELELVAHVLGAHDLAGPLAVDVIELVDLEPRSNTSGILGGVDGAEQHVSDGSRVARLVPLDLDGVSLAGLNGVGDTSLSVDVAGHVLAGDIGHGAVRGRHPNADLVARGLSIDPELVEVLVG